MWTINKMRETQQHQLETKTVKDRNSNTDQQRQRKTVPRDAKLEGHSVERGGHGHNPFSQKFNVKFNLKNE